MPDFNANEDLARLPAAGPGGPGEPASGPRSGGTAVASPATPSVYRASPPPSAAGGRSAPGVHPIAARAAAPAASSSQRAAAAPEKRSRAILRYLDLIVLAVATVPALVLGAPALGYAVGAGAWVLQRILAQADRRWISNATEPRTQLGLNLFEAFGRIWLLAGAIVAAGVLGGRADGLTAALTIFGAYSVAFAVKVSTGPPAAPQKPKAGR